MKQLSIISLITVLGASAFAYRDGSYSCKNIQGLPNNDIKITSVTIPGATAGQAPYVEMTRYYRNSEGSEITKVQFRGFPNVVKTNNSELFYLGGVELEFQNSELLGCQK